MVEAAHWIEYERGLRETNRHVPSDAAYFDALFKGCMVCETALAVGSTLYRARFSNDTDTDPLPLRQMGMPPAERARDQRITPAGVPCFYAAFEPDTAMAELRPWPLARLTVATFHTASSFNVLDLRRANPQVRQSGTVDFAAYMISRPVDPDDALRYVGTQYLAQKLKGAGATGLLYDSMLKPGGTNIAMFGDSGLMPASACLHILTDVTYRATRCLSTLIQTERLSLLTDSDGTYEWFVDGLRTDPDVQAYIGNLAPHAADVAHMLTILEAENPVGIVALVKSPAGETDKDIGLLCAITQSARRGGRATEACQAVMKWAGTTGRWTRLLACVDQRNEDSRQLVVKLGFQFQRRRTTGHGHAEDVFAFDLPS